MILGIFKISGHSMLPTFRPSDKVIATSFPYFFSKPKIGDIVLFAKDGKTIVKRIVGINNKSITVEGDNNNDSSYNLDIKKHEIIGKVVFRIR